MSIFIIASATFVRLITWYATSTAVSMALSLRSLNTCAFREVSLPGGPLLAPLLPLLLWGMGASKRLYSRGRLPIMPPARLLAPPPLPLAKAPPLIFSAMACAIGVPAGTNVASSLSIVSLIALSSIPTPTKPMLALKSALD